MKLSASSLQLQAGLLYMNTFDNMYDLGLGVWTHLYNKPIYILRDNSGNIGFIQFENKRFADRWLKENSEWWSVDQIIDK